MAKPKILILEGHRMAGKTTVAKHLRNSINYATLINFTGFPEDGPEGLVKIRKYYMNWLEYIKSHAGDDMTFIFDRFLFSEIVFSRLYKEYDFGPHAGSLIESLLMVADVELIHFHMTDKDELTMRAKREKVEYRNVSDSLSEVAKQRKGYREMIKQLKNSEYAANMTITEQSMNGLQSKDVAIEISDRWNNQ